jgi:hypothetical protein
MSFVAFAMEEQAVAAEATIGVEAYGMRVGVSRRGVGC